MATEVREFGGAAAGDRLPTAAISVSRTIPSAVEERLTQLDTYCTLLPLRRAIARARLQVRAYAFDHEHRGTRLLAWAAAIDALAHTLRTVPPQHTDADRIEQLTNTLSSQGVDLQNAAKQLEMLAQRFMKPESGQTK